MAAIEMSIKELEYERLKQILFELQEYATYVYLYEDSAFEERQDLANVYKQNIIDTLLDLEL